MESEHILNTIFDIKQHNEDYEDSDLLDFVAEIVDEARDNPYFFKHLENCLKDKRRDLGYCPECGYELSYGKYRQYHNELTEDEYTPYEEFTFAYCPNTQCGWSEENE